MSIITIIVNRSTVTVILDLFPAMKQYIMIKINTEQGKGWSIIESDDLCIVKANEFSNRSTPCQWSHIPRPAAVIIQGADIKGLVQDYYQTGLLDLN